AIGRKRSGADGRGSADARTEISLLLAGVGDGKFLGARAHAVPQLRRSFDLSRAALTFSRQSVARTRSRRLFDDRARELLFDRRALRRAQSNFRGLQSGEVVARARRARAVPRRAGRGSRADVSVVRRNMAGISKEFLPGLSPWG